jgi:hypothetical protein
MVDPTIVPALAALPGPNPVESPTGRMQSRRAETSRPTRPLPSRHRHRRLGSRRDGRSPGMRSSRLARFGGAAPLSLGESESPPADVIIRHGPEKQASDQRRTHRRSASRDSPRFSLCRALGCTRFAQARAARSDGESGGVILRIRAEAGPAFARARCRCPASTLHDSRGSDLRGLIGCPDGNDVPPELVVPEADRAHGT